MTDSEWFDRLNADFDKLKKNRERVPLKELETTYKKSYTSLVASLTEAADWFADRCLRSIIDGWPRHPMDKAGNDWMERQIAVIIEQENQPGCLRDQWRAAIIDHLDRAEFEELVWRRYDLCEKRAFDPYWQRHNHWVGPPENRWIFNDIIRRFWLPPGTDSNWPKGAWLNNKREVYSSNWPPNIGPDKGDAAKKQE